MIKNHLRIYTLFFIVGLLLFAVANYTYRFNCTIDNLNNYKSEYYEYTVTISEFPYEKDGYVNAYGNIVSSTHPVDFKNYRILFKIPASYKAKVEYGNSIKVKGYIQPARTSNNYGNFDYRKYLMSKNTIGVCYADENFKIQIVSHGKGINDLLYDFQKKIKSNSEIYFDGETLALIKSMLTGDREDINDNMREDFQASGIYHIVAVSGLHTGIFISIFAYFLAFLPLKSFRKNIITRLSAVIISLLLLMFTGYGISITRVILMSSIVSICLLAKREYNIMTSLISSAIIILIFTPYNLYNQSFQLSFASTFGLCLALKLNEIINKKFKKVKRFEYIKTSILISIGSTITTAPLCSALFGSVSLIGVIVNIIVIPLATILLGTMIVFFTLALILPQQFMHILSTIPRFIANIIISLAHIVSDIKYASIDIELLQVLVVYAGICVIALVIFSIIKRKYRYGVIAFIIASLIVTVSISPSQKEATVTFVNCSKGECTILKTPGGKNIMFDCGSSTFDDAFKDIFEPYLKHTKTYKIDTLYISYFDDEHISAVNQIIANGYVNSVVIPPESIVKSELVNKNRLQIIATARRFNIPITCITDNVNYKIDENITVSLVSDILELENKNSTAVYKINYNDTTFVLSSCIGAKGQELLTNIDTCTVLKTPNFGNSVKATTDYILGFKPEYAVITAPESIKYNTVDEELLNTLNNNNIITYRTDYNQTITFFTNGERITSVKLKRGE